MKKISTNYIYEKCIFSVSRSSGAGGQHVNKTNSAVYARIDIYDLDLSADQVNLIIEKLAHKLIQNRFLQTRSEIERDQLSNKKFAVNALADLLNNALILPKKRKKTKPTRSSVEKRLTSKSKKSVIKKLRQEKL